MSKLCRAHVEYVEIMSGLCRNMLMVCRMCVDIAVIIVNSCQHYAEFMSNHSELMSNMCRCCVRFSCWLAARRMFLRIKTCLALTHLDPTTQDFPPALLKRIPAETEGAKAEADENASKKARTALALFSDNELL